MADISQCLEKLVATGGVSRAIADEALEFFKRSKAEFSKDMGPASADAAAALEAAKKLRDTARKNQIAISADVKTFALNERRVVEDPRGGYAAIAGMVSKDTRRGENSIKALAKQEPDHPILTGPNADYKYHVARDQMYSMLGADMEKLRAGFFASKAVLRSSENFIKEIFGVSTGDEVAGNVARAFGQVSDFGADRAIAAGKVLDKRDDWRIPQPWRSARVEKFSEAEFVKDFRDAMQAGGLKLWDKDTNRYATPDRFDFVLQRAYSDIKNEGGTSAPFSKEMRTFEFQPGQPGADAWLKLQAKYGVGNEIMSMIDHHIDNMARTIALHETFGAHPEAQFKALMRLAKDKNPGKPVNKLTAFVENENTLEKTFDIISGRGHAVANETFARIGAGARNMIGAASLRNLPITIMPSDTAMTFLASNHLGMSGFDVLGHTFDGTMTKDVARHLQIASHTYMDYMADTVRRYEDQINWTGLTRKLPRAVVKATGADLWTTNGRLGWQVSALHQFAGWRDLPFDQVPQKFRDNFLTAYGFTPADWDKIRAAPVYDAGNGAMYLDPTKIDKPLSERLLMAVKEQGSYAFHQPDARTQAIMTPREPAGTFWGETLRSMGQYKQFAMERLTTHIMRVMVDGPMETRIGRGLAFTLLSAAAGAVSLQTAAVLRGEDPLNMSEPKFWIEAFAKGGAGGVYGDLLAAAIRGQQGAITGLAGPIPGLVGDLTTLVSAPIRAEIQEPGKQTKPSAVFNIGRRWTPNTWYTKLAVDRLLWDKMQVLLDPDYRASFRRAEQRARKEGQGFWWGRGESAPERAPDFSTALGGH